MRNLITLLGAITLFFQSQAQVETLVIGDNNNGQIVTSDMTGGSLDTITTSYFSFYDADVDHTNQKIYTAWYYGIYRFNYDGTQIDTLVNYPTGGYSDGVTIDERAGKIYWTSTPEDLILSADLDGTNIDTVLQLPTSFYLTDIDIDTVNNKFYFGSWITSGKGVFSCNLDGTAMDTIIFGMDCEYLGLDVNQGQIMYSNNSEVRRINYNSTGDTLVFSFQPGGMLLNENDGLWYISDMTNNRIVTCNSNGTNFNEFLNGSLDSPHGPVFISQSSASLAEESILNSTLYPNPTNGKITIDLGGLYNNVRVVQYNLLGQIVKEESFDSIELIDTTVEGKPGAYQVAIFVENQLKAQVSVMKE